MNVFTEYQTRSPLNFQAAQTHVSKLKATAKEGTKLELEEERVNNSSSTGPAMQAVLNTAELLENILLYVPFFNLIISQRVSTLWRYTITQSTPLKQKLFLAAEPIQHRWRIAGVTQEFLQSIETVRATGLPLLPHHLHSRLPTRDTVVPTQEVYPVRLNPILAHDGPRLNPEPKPALWTFGVWNFFNQRAFAHLTRTLHRKPREASWRRMYLCNPPCTEVKALLTFEVSMVPVHSATVGVHVKEDAGITFGLLVDRAMEAEILTMDEKKCLKGQATAAEYVEYLEELHQRPACFRSTLGSTAKFQLKGVAVSRDEEWKEIIRAARGIA